jgi:hypothetical protein
VKLAMLQPALLCPPPATQAETHLTLIADSGTVVQPLKVCEVVPTIKVHVRPLFPCAISQVIVATVPPRTTPPGLFAMNGIVLGVARSSLTWLNWPGKVLWPEDGKASVGWRLPGVEV